MIVRGVRGAITAAQDTPEEILGATQELLKLMMERNPALAPEDLASAFFSLTPDLVSTHPAKAARLMGWTQVPLFCAQEIPVPDGLPMCIRVLLHWNTPLAQDEIVHVYLRGAAVLRPDLAAGH